MQIELQLVLVPSAEPTPSHARFVESFCPRGGGRHEAMLGGVGPALRAGAGRRRSGGINAWLESEVGGAILRRASREVRIQKGDLELPCTQCL